MNEPISRDELLATLESMLEAQLRALRSVRGKKLITTAPGPNTRRKSNMLIIEDILRAADEPLHISEIIARAASEHHRTLKRESVVSALTKKVLDRQTFRRTGPNRFALLEQEDHQP